MTRRSRTRRLTAAITVTALVASACGSVPTVPDLATEDVLFLNGLRQGDVEITSTAAAINAGRGACTSLDHGAGVPAAVKDLLVDQHPDHASAIVVSAIHSYCPRHAGLLSPGPS
jgi:hypothetical protein